METARQTQMRRALELAERGWGRVSPNPMVGALVVDDRDGSVLGEGWHEGPGTAHAEVMALAAAGDLARGAPWSARSNRATTSVARHPAPVR